MANNDSNPQRDSRRPEDNPFIAFRRFADSQVSSLLNTVLTLPATIAHHNKAHQARELCLFGKADERTCERLYAVESDIAERRHEGKELFRVGDIQAVLKNSEELMRLDTRADELRADILGQSGEAEEERALVQRVGTEKGQEWGWSHSWGWPSPFDDKGSSSRATTEDNLSQRSTERDLMLQLRSEVKDLMGEKAYNETMAALMRVFRDDHPQNDTTEMVRCRADENSRTDSQKPRAWTWSRSWQWPPPADSLCSSDAAYSPRELENNPYLKGAGVHWREAYDDLLRTERGEGLNSSGDAQNASRNYKWRSRCARHRNQGGVDHGEPKAEFQGQLETHDEPSYEYSHDHEDQHDDPPTPRTDRGKRHRYFQTPKDEDDQTFQQEQELRKSLERQQQTKQQFWELLGHSAPEQAQTETSAQRNNATELDAYEAFTGCQGTAILKHATCKRNEAIHTVHSNNHRADCWP